MKYLIGFLLQDNKALQDFVSLMQDNISKRKISQN